MEIVYYLKIIYSLIFLLAIKSVLKGSSAEILLNNEPA
jgi:hypothetical protein